jgi:LPXTG-motif cell wall-anchored protein
MNAQITTIISGIVLLAVFALVAWRKRRRSASDGDHPRK